MEPTAPIRPLELPDLVGNTPLLHLDRVLGKLPFHLFGKFEGANTTGSSKDRPALEVIERALERGEIDRETTIIESSSGNMGIALAQVCGRHGLRFICVVDPKITGQSLALLKAYGAEIEMVPAPDAKSGEFLIARLDRIDEMLVEIPNSYWTRQYSNPDNPRAHFRTMREIAEGLDGQVDYLFIATGSCGTIRGCADYIAENHLETQLVAVDAVGSVIYGGERTQRLIPGFGSAKRPQIFREGMADGFVKIDDQESVIGCHWLVQREAILGGGSSGAVIMAIDRMRQQIRPESNVVALLPDRGDRYLDTIYSVDWVKEHFGDICHLWESKRQVPTRLPASPVPLQ